MQVRAIHRIILTAMALVGLFAIVPATKAAELPLLIQEEFDDGATRWQPADPRSWKVVETPEGRIYSLFQQSDYKPPHRSPVNIALLKDVTVGDFALELQLQSTVKDYDHRSMVLVFGYQDPAHFYYVHFGKKTDDHANQVFIVNGAPRVKISSETNPGTRWDDGWHKVKIVRDAADGDIEVYFDDMKHTAMEAIDRTFSWGQIGIGAFDDLGNFDHIVLRGKTVSPR
jgi:hypothetical protein